MRSLVLGIWSDERMKQKKNRLNLGQITFSTAKVLSEYYFNPVVLYIFSRLYAF